ncbi:MAG: dipeptide/oligopeptide/nickel ABC transporter permease/ATP-binding protein [Anaerolineae bacterium]|nr:dipeptide/oligopeptide/nickel ABC transporter permease/ATP-binding protein [Anaerolineae bacterium]
MNIVETSSVALAGSQDARSESNVQARAYVSSPGRAWRRFRRQPAAVLSAAFILALYLISVIGPWVAPYGPLAGDLRATMQGPSAAHWLGTDQLGRDILSQLIYGTRISMWGALQAIGVALLLGVPLGLLAGYVGGALDSGLTWGVDLLFALPPIMVAFAVIAILGASLSAVMLAIGLTFSTRFFRLARAVTLAEREELYVDSARVGGLGVWSITAHHILPNIAPTLIAQTALQVGAVVLIEATLSFIGIGATMEQPSWGRMLSQARTYMGTHPFLAFPSGAAITLTVLAFNLLGDGLQTAFGRESVAARPRSRPAPPASAAPPTQAIESPPALLALRGLEVRFPDAQGGEVVILRDVSLEMKRGEILGLVGESGSGKTMTSLAIMDLIPPPGRLAAGSIRLEGKDLRSLPAAAWHRLRGQAIALVFQDAHSSLNPALTIETQLIDPLRIHIGLSQRQARRRALELLTLVRIPDPQRRLHEYPHQLSGGMAQRVALARALAGQPTVLIADEPTSALDVTVQGQILDLLKDVQRQFDMAILLITHDLGVVAETCDRVAVMYAGEIVEAGPTHALFHQPKHPYTQALLATLPQYGRIDGRLPVIPGLVPPPHAWPLGCHFHPRCPLATEACRAGTPALQPLGPDRLTRCLRAQDMP